MKKNKISATLAYLLSILGLFSLYMGFVGINIDVTIMIIPGFLIGGLIYIFIIWLYIDDRLTISETDATFISFSGAICVFWSLANWNTWLTPILSQICGTYGIILLIISYALYQKAIKDSEESLKKFEEEQRQRQVEQNKIELEHKENEMKKAYDLIEKGGLSNLQRASEIYTTYGYSIHEISIEIAKEKERLLDYEGAIDLFEKSNLHDDAKRVRRKRLDEKKLDQTVVHGDYVDDRDTIVKDSVINRSNVGGGSSKMQELEKLAEMKDKGIIDDDEFKQMKKEILGK